MKFDFSNITQNISNGKVYTSISITRIVYKKQADKFIDAIEGTQSFMNFKVKVCPDFGEYTVFVTTIHDVENQWDVQDIVGMLMSLMFDAITNTTQVF